MHGSEALDLAWLASGRLDAAIMLSNLPWDVSGGVLLVRESGGVVTDLDGSEHGLASSVHDRMHSGTARGAARRAGRGISMSSRRPRIRACGETRSCVRDGADGRSDLAGEDARMEFVDRHDAGRQLAAQLSPLAQASARS